LKNEGFRLDVITTVMQEYQSIGFAKTINKSVLASMNDLVHQYEFEIMREGGVNNIRILPINQRINRTPMGALKYESPIEALKKLI
jgi:hypothetical protein